MNISSPLKLVFLIFLAAPYSVVQGDDVVITNSPSGAARSQIGSTDWKAMVFSTSSRQEQIKTIQLGLNCYSNTCTYPKTENVRIDLYSVRLGLPDEQIYSLPLQAVAMGPGAGEMYTFSVPNWIVDANTSYALVLKSDASGIGWGNTASSTTPTAQNGYSYISFKKSADSGVTWTNPSSSVNALVISVGPISVPTLSQWVQLMLALMVIGVAWHFHNNRQNSY